MTVSKYRPDIDGLRTIAVLAVLFYHVGFAPFRGGYVGVDVFFVISGFLITRLIRDEVAASGRFDFGNFYVRRARRLFPALFVTLLFSFAASAALLSPEHLQRMGGAAMHALLSLSNVFFWAEADYFDAAAEFKPLLHTWSLSVEEQYYFFWPAFLVFLLKCRRRWALAAGLGGAAAASLALNLVFQDGESAMLSRLSPAVAAWFADGRATIFYLTPFRVFEFALGAALVWADNRQPRQAWAQELLLLAGFALMVWAVCTFDSETLFPSVNALIPCIGAGLAIYAGRARYLGYLLRNRASVYIGLISYSLYLVHWPVIVFYKYRTFDALSLGEQIAICVAAVAAAALMHRFVEQPFRRARQGSLSAPAFGLVCALCAVALILPAANAWANHGWPWRARGAPALDIAAIRAEREAAIRAPVCHLNKKGQEFSDFIAGFESCNALGDRNILVLGDSHAAEIYVALARRSEALRGAHLVQLTGAGCNLVNLDTEYCREMTEFATDLVRREKGRVWTIAYADNLDHLVNRINNNNGEAHFSFIRERISAFTDEGAAFNWITRPQFEDPQKTLAAAFDLNDYQRRHAATLRRQHFALAGEIRVVMNDNPLFRVLDLADFLCDETARCRVLSPDERHLYWDYGHFTVYGSEYVGAYIAEGILTPDR